MSQFSLHSAVRAAQRNVSIKEVHYIMAFGKRFYRAGAIICYLRRRDLPEWDRSDDRWTRLVGTAVVLSQDGGTIITVWRNRQTGLKRIKSKPPFWLRSNSQPEMEA